MTASNPSTSETKVAPPSNRARPKLRLRRRTLAAFAAVTAIAGVVLIQRSTGWAQYEGSTQRIAVDLSRPDALLRTASLAELPKDLLRVPMAKELLTEEFVFRYERDPDRLGLIGTLRRLAYEHDLSFRDELLVQLLNEPAEIAFWRDGKGALRHWALIVGRSVLARLAQEVALLAGKDRQITAAGELVVGDGAMPLFAVEVSPARTFLVGSIGDRLLVLSDPGLLLSAENEIDTVAATTLARLLAAGTSDPNLFREHFALPDKTSRHTLVVSAGSLSFGYDTFFPSLEALRFDFDGQAWSTQLLLDADRLPNRSLASAELAAGVPAGAAVATLLPVDWKLGAPLAIGDSTVEKAAQDLAAALSGPVALAWYPSGRIFTPLAVATLGNEIAIDRPLGALFSHAVREPSEDAAMGPQKRKDGTLIWQRRLDVALAGKGESGAPAPGTLTVTLARRGRYLLFSPDAALVERGLETIAKNRPSLRETGGVEDGTLGVVAPRYVAELMEKEALAVLPPEGEPVFRAAAEGQLVPRLRAVAQFPAYRLVLANPGRGRGWRAVAWRRISP